MSGLPSVDPRPVLDNLIITGNTSNGGSAIFSYTGHQFSVQNSEIYNNSLAGDPALPASNPGIGMMDTDLTIDRVLFHDNSGGVAVEAAYSSNVLITHSTIVNHINGLMAKFTSNIDVYNSIVYNNSYNSVVVDGESDININYSNIEGGWDGAGNINSDPTFTDAENDDFTLQGISPCIDAGTVDFNDDGVDDVDDYIGNAPDMGAYEFSIVTTGLQGYLTGSSVILSWDPFDGVVYYQLERSTDSLFTTDVISNFVQENTYTDDDLEYNTHYYYRVAAFSSYLTGWSNVVSVILESVSTSSESEIPIQFAIHQNYPNPFNPITNLSYDLPEDGIVNITIYDMMGRVVHTLVNDYQTSGYKKIQWNATNDSGDPVSAGVYLYQIDAGSFSQTKKMILLK